MSTIPVANLPPVSLIPVAIWRRGGEGVDGEQEGGKVRECTGGGEGVDGEQEPGETLASASYLVALLGERRTPEISGNNSEPNLSISRVFVPDTYYKDLRRAFTVYQYRLDECKISVNSMQRKYIRNITHLMTYNR